MSTTLKIRWPSPERPHTLEVAVPFDMGRSNWTIRAQESKSGAGRGCSPHWYGWKAGDVLLARQLAAAPAMYDLLLQAERAVWEQCSEVVDGVRTAFGDERGEPWRSIADLLSSIQAPAP